MQRPSLVSRASSAASSRGFAMPSVHGRRSALRPSGANSPASTSAWRMPWPASTARTRSAAWPWAMPFKVTPMPGRHKRRRCGDSSRSRQPTRARAAATSRGSGSRPSRRAASKACHSGCTVTSNAPALRRDTAWAMRSTCSNSAGGAESRASRFRRTRALSGLNKDICASMRRSVATAASSARSSVASSACAACSVKVVPKPSSTRRRHSRSRLAAAPSPRAASAPRPRPARRKRRRITTRSPGRAPARAAAGSRSHARAAARSTVRSAGRWHGSPRSPGIENILRS